MLTEPATASPSAFVIAGNAHASALRRRLQHDPTITVFSESESLDALRLILSHPPKLLALDSTLARSARGALIVSRVKEQVGVEVRVLNEDEGNLPVLLGRQDVPLHAASRPIDGCGTRGAKRYSMQPNVEVVVDGERSRLVNLSLSGAQVVVPARVQPRQMIRITLITNGFVSRIRARVAWSTVEFVESVMRYRAGVTFVEADARAIETFCHRHAATC